MLFFMDFLTHTYLLDNRKKNIRSSNMKDRLASQKLNKHPILHRRSECIYITWYIRRRCRILINPVIFESTAIYTRLARLISWRRCSHTIPHGVCYLSTPWKKETYARETNSKLKKRKNDDRRLKNRRVNNVYRKRYGAEEKASVSVKNISSSSSCVFNLINCELFVLAMVFRSAQFVIRTGIIIASQMRVYSP